MHVVVVCRAKQILVVARELQALPLYLAVRVDDPLLEQTAGAMRQQRVAAHHQIEGVVLFYRQARSRSRLSVRAVRETWMPAHAARSRSPVEQWITHGIHVAVELGHALQRAISSMLHDLSLCGRHPIVRRKDNGDLRCCRSVVRPPVCIARVREANAHIGNRQASVSRHALCALEYFLQVEVLLCVRVAIREQVLQRRQSFAIGLRIEFRASIQSLGGVVHVELRVRRRRSFRWKQFASTVSHELRNPITLIAGYSRRLLRRADNLSDEQRHQLAIVEEESRRLGRLVTDLLALTRAEMGHLQMNLQPLYVCDAVQQAIALCEGSGEQRFSLCLPENLDPHTIHALADRDQVVQCLVNLIENACKYSPPQSPVEIGCRREQSMVLLSVRDHGPGVPADERDQVFERFQRGRNKGEIPGTGIGLAVVKTLIEQMGGSVSVQDAEGGGAVFVLALKTCAAPPAAAPVPVR